MTDRKSCLNSDCHMFLLMIINKDQIKITVANNKIVLYVNRLTEPLPYKSSSFRDISYDIFQFSSVFTRVKTNTGIKVDWDGYSRLYVQVPNWMKGQFRGMAGNFNFKTNDEYLTSSRDVTHSAVDFGNSWLLPNCTALSTDLHLTACESNHQIKTYAERECNIIKSPVFAVCHKVVEHQPYYEHCKEDSCNCKGDKKCSCSVIAAYARACANAGKVIEDWRSTSNCGKNVFY